MYKSEWLASWFIGSIMFEPDQCSLCGTGDDRAICLACQARIQAERQYYAREWVAFPVLFDPETGLSDDRAGFDIIDSWLGNVAHVQERELAVQYVKQLYRQWVLRCAIPGLTVV